MILPTLWDRICRLTAEDRQGWFTVEEAAEGSAVNLAIAGTEIRRFVAEGLLERNGDDTTFKLTDKGSKQCLNMHQSQRYTGF